MNELFHLLGFTGYYRKFIPLFANINKQLNRLLRKDTKFQWLQHCQAAFEHLKQALFKGTMLQYPSTTKPYMLYTDASHFTYSGVLTQAFESPEDLRPVAFASGLFSEMQQRWSATKKEAYAVFKRGKLHVILQS